MEKSEFEKRLAAVPAVSYEDLDEEDKELFDEMKKIKQYSGNLSLKIPKELHEILVSDAKRQGVSLNQYCLFKLAQGAPYVQRT